MRRRLSLMLNPKLNLMLNLKLNLKSILFSSLIVVFASNARAATEIWVYTSVYREFIAPIQAAFEKRNPEIKVQVYQAGSEKIQAKLEAEFAAQKPQADLLVVSDPFYAAMLDKRGLIQPIAKGEIWRTNYNSLMVMLANKKVPTEKRPKSFSDLTKPEFKSLVQMGSPLESGTCFATVAILADRFGWEYFSKLRDNGFGANGGNAYVIQKVESGEKKFGIALIENVLAAQKKGSPIEIIYPEDGAIPIPSVQVLLKSSNHADAAKKFADFLLTREAQEILLSGFMYSVVKTLPPPTGALPIDQVSKKTRAWTPELLRTTAEQAKKIKSKFSELLLE